MSVLDDFFSMDIVELKDWRDSLLTQIDKNMEKAIRLGEENGRLLELAKKIGKVIDAKGCFENEEKID